MIHQRVRKHSSTIQLGWANDYFKKHISYRSNHS